MGSCEAEVQGLRKRVKDNFTEIIEEFESHNRLKLCTAIGFSNKNIYSSWLDVFLHLNFNMELAVQYIASVSSITALKKKNLGLLKVCSHDRACPTGTGEHERKQTVVPCPWIEAKQSLYFKVDTGEIIT